MRSLLDLARLLISSWVMASNDTHMPINDGLLDKALYNLQQNNKLPTLFDKIHFCQARTGLKCVELPQILADSESAGFIQSTYSQHVSILISKRAARILLSRLSVSEEEGLEFGNNLLEAIKEIREEYGETF